VMIDIETTEPPTDSELLALGKLVLEIGVRLVRLETSELQAERCREAPARIDRLHSNVTELVTYILKFMRAIQGDHDSLEARLTTIEKEIRNGNNESSEGGL